MSIKFFMYLPLYLFVFVCVAKNASAQTYTGPYATGMGGAGRASVTPLEAGYMNPAQLGFISNNHFYGFYVDEERQGLDATQMGALIIDSSTSDLFKGSLSYTQEKVDLLGGDIKKRTFELSLGRIEYSQLAFGIAVKRQEWDELFGDKEADHDITIGSTYAVTRDLGIAFVIYNLLEESKLRTPRKYALATYYIWEPFMKLAFDLTYQEENNSNKHIDMMGGMALPFGPVDFLLGYAKLSVVNEEFFTSGLIWNGPRLSIGYSYRDGSKDTKTHNIDFGLFF